MAPLLSVIIPTHKRADILIECLRHLEKQTIASAIEVIVVSDGHDDKTSALFVQSSFQIPVTFLEIEKSQQGNARNVGTGKAQGTYVLFIGDDIFLQADACAKHIETHEERRTHSDERVDLPTPRYPLIAILGFTTWDPCVGITPVMRWLEKSGWQFGYPSIARYAHGPIPKEMQHRYTYTSHLSLPLEIAKKHPFRTDVHLYGWEDVEWGMRLRDAGVQLWYEPAATALHHHHITLEQSLERMRTLGKSAVEIASKVPSFDRVPRGWKLLVYRILSFLPTMAGRHRKALVDQLKRTK